MSVAPPRSAALSQIVVHVETPLAPLREQLETRIERRLAEGRFGIGPAGKVGYGVERGALALWVAGDRLVVQAPVHARAEACRGETCYASCEPSAIVTAEVPLRLRADYGFEPTRVALRFTRGCKVKALGGFLTIDLTPSLESAVEPELATVARKLDQQLIDLREDVKRLWAELSTPRELPLGGCLMLQPQRIVQGPLDDSSASVHARFAVLARPELRTSCGSSSPALPPPSLDRSPRMADEGAIMLGLVTPLDEWRSAFMSGQDIAVDQRHVRVTQPMLTTFGSDLIVELTLGGDLCGELAFVATPSFARDGAFIGLGQPRWLAGERERVAARDVNPDALLRALAAIPRVPPLLSVTALQSAAPLAHRFSPPNLDLNAKISSARGAGAAAREDGLVAWIELIGRLDVKAETLPNRLSP